MPGVFPQTNGDGDAIIVKTRLQQSWLVGKYSESSMQQMEFRLENA